MNTRLKRTISRWTDSDWLLILMAVAGLLLLCFNVVTWANDLIFSGQSSRFLSGFLTLALLSGYLGGWLKQLQVASPARQFNQTLFGPVGLVCLWLGLPVATFYGAQAGQLGSAIGAGVLMIGFTLAGAVLSSYRKFWGLIIAIIIISWLINWFGPAFNLVETDLVKGGNNALYVVMFGLGLLGVIVSGTELIKKRSSFSRPNRYLSIFSPKNSFPSYTGTGAMLISGLLSLVRDKFFWLLVALALTIELFTSIRLTGLTDNGRFFLAVILPNAIIAGGALGLVERFQEKFLLSYRYLPIEPGAVKLTLALAGLIVFTLVLTLANVGLFQLTFGTSLNLVALTVGAYSVAALISAGDRQNSQAVFGWAWPVIYRAIAFGGTLVILVNLPGWSLLFVSLTLLTLAILKLGFRTPVNSVTI